MTLPPDPASATNSSTLHISLFLFAAISFLVYKFVLSAPPETRTQATAPSSQTVVTPQRNTAAASTSSAPRASQTINSSSDNSSDDYFNYGTNRHPSHLIPPEKWEKSTSLSKYLLNGIVPFRSTPANGYENRLQKELSSDDLIVTNRKDRARIFARLFSLTATDDGIKKPPPNRGANIVVTVYTDDASCDKLQKALMLLGTYYNLFVLVDGSDLGGKSMKEQREIVRTFREKMINAKNKEQTKAGSSYHLNDQILPPHRIVFLSTTAGRVAFVRQLNGVELVVDGSTLVRDELLRFGHRVLVYPKGGGDGSSALGKFLIP